MPVGARAVVRVEEVGGARAGRVVARGAVEERRRDLVARLSGPTREQERERGERVPVRARAVVRVEEVGGARAGGVVARAAVEERWRDGVGLLAGAAREQEGERGERIPARARAVVRVEEVGGARARRVVARVTVEDRWRDGVGPIAGAAGEQEGERGERVPVRARAEARVEGEHEKRDGGVVAPAAGNERRGSVSG